MTIDLSTLPAPNVIEALDEPTILAANLAQFQALMPGTTLLASDPAMKVLQTGAYRELLLRARINDASRTNLPAFCAGSDLDQYAASVGLTRMPGELDPRLLQRILLQIAAQSGNGTAESYCVQAMTASIDVVSAAAVANPGGGVALMLWVDAAASPQSVLATVQAYFAQITTLILGVPLWISLAVAMPVAIAATIYRAASAPVDLVATLSGGLPAVFAAIPFSTRTLLLDWIKAQLYIAGVSKVALTAPSQDVALAINEYAVLGALSLNDGGVA